MVVRNGIDLTLTALLKTRPTHASDTNKMQASSKAVGGVSGRKRGMGMDLYELRAFVHGDDIRHIDASATARTGRPHIKTFQEENDQSSFLIVDFRNSMFWGTRNALRSFSAAMCIAKEGWHIADTDGRFSLLILLDDKLHHLGPLHGEAGMQRICEELCHFHQLAMQSQSNIPLSLDAALYFARDVTQAGANLYIATSLDDVGVGFNDALRELRQRNVEFKIIRDPVETASTKRALPVMSETTGIQWLNFSAQTASLVVKIFDETQIKYSFETSEGAHI